MYLKRIVADARLKFEEMSMVLCQIEVCLNSRPLVSLDNTCSHNGILTPGHFIIGRPLTALPDNSTSDQPSSLIRRWITGKDGQMCM